MAGFEKYNTRVRIGPSAGGVILPIDSLRIFVVPYVPTGSTVDELFDGNRKLNVPTYGYTIELDWKELRDHSSKIWQALNYMFTNDGADFFPHYDTATAGFDETKLIEDVIPDLTQDALSVIFTGRVRQKPSSIRLVSKSQGDIIPKTWITD